MSDYKTVVLYKRGVLSSNGIRELRAAGMACVAVNGEFDQVMFRAQGVGFMDTDDKMQVMVVKAALDTFNFEGKLGNEITKVLRARVKELDNKP